MVLASEDADNERMEAVFSREMFPFLVEHIVADFSIITASNSVCNLVVDDVDDDVDKLLTNFTVEDIEDALEVRSLCVLKQ